jgi:hypothetical protein
MGELRMTIVSSPLRPAVQKGAIAAYGLPDLVPTIVVFQCNPDTVSRSLQPRGSTGGGRGDAQRVNGPPSETISMSVRIHAADQLEFPDQNRAIVENGLHPAIAALEGLLYPAYPAVIANQAMALAGSAFILGEQSPLAFLIWGARRVLPVQLAGLTLREEAFDPKLNPIHVTADLNLRVLTYRDLDVTNPGYWVYLAAFTQKEVMAAIDVTTPRSGPAPLTPI